MADIPMIHDDMSDKIISAAEEIAEKEGAESLSVSRILHALGITNRVFYNRFHNIGEVLSVVYRKTVLLMRKSIIEKFDPNGDFFSQVVDIVANTLSLSYKLKSGINQFVFEQDSENDENFAWWNGEIKKLIGFGIKKKFLRPMNIDSMSYAIWCFIRGYNADALARRLPEQEAVAGFRYSFSVLLDGMRA